MCYLVQSVFTKHTSQKCQLLLNASYHLNRTWNLFPKLAIHSFMEQAVAVLHLYRGILNTVV